MTNNLNLADLTLRLEKLEAIEDIKTLKARYLNACDKQDPEAVRACFVKNGAIIDMDYFGYCDNRNTFVDDIFIPRGCHDHVLDMHQCSNPEITLLDASHATGVWSLNYRNINTQDHSITLISALYHDEYQREHGEWRIAKSRTEYRTALRCNYQADSLKVDIAARALVGG